MLINNSAKLSQAAYADDIAYMNWFNAAMHLQDLKDQLLELQTAIAAQETVCTEYYATSEQAHHNYNTLFDTLYKKQTSNE
jgi:hypothetical protein